MAAWNDGHPRDPEHVALDLLIARVDGLIDAVRTERDALPFSEPTRVYPSMVLYHIEQYRQALEEERRRAMIVYQPNWVF